MKEKLLLFKDAEGLTQSKLAEILETQPGNISHILSGRSKPGFELLQKLLLRFPRLNPDWLLLDKGPMYREESESSSSPLGSTNSSMLGADEKPAPDLASLFSQPNSPTESSSAEGVAKLASTSRGVAVSRVVIFYADHSFESFEPKS